MNRPGTVLAARVAAVSSIVLGVFLSREVLGEAHEHLGNVTSQTVLVVILLGCCLRIVNIATVHAAHPGTKWGKVAVAAELQSVCSCVLIGGGLVGAGMRSAVLSRSAVTDPAVFAAILLTSVTVPAGQWAATTLASVGLLLYQVEVVAIIAGVVGLAAFGTYMIAWKKLRGLQPFDLYNSEGYRARLQIKYADRAAVADAVREHARLISSTIVMKTLALAALGVLLTSTLFGFIVADVTGSPLGATVEAALLVTIARIYTLLSPLPGGAGSFDVGLVVLLTEGPIDAPMAVAVVGLFRAATIAPRIVTGSIAACWWVGTRTPERRNRK